MAQGGGHVGVPKTNNEHNRADSSATAKNYGEPMCKRVKLTCKVCRTAWYENEYASRPKRRSTLCATCAARRWEAEQKSARARAWEERRSAGVIH